MKAERQNKIVELIGKYEIETQEELAKRLQEAGFRVTQATISRDIRNLNLTKVATGSGKQKYVALQVVDSMMFKKYFRVLKEGFVSMDMAQNLLVIRTVAGMAMAVAAAVDALNYSEIVGVIAGDDTVMCAIRTVEDTKILLSKFKKLLKED